MWHCSNSLTMVFNMCQQFLIFDFNGGFFPSIMSTQQESLVLMARRFHAAEQLHDVLDPTMTF